MIKTVKTNHAKQNGSGYCGLYALSNLVNDNHIISLTDYVEKDGGSSCEQLNDLLIPYDLELGIIYYSMNDAVPLKDKKAYYDDDYLATMRSDNFIMLLVGLRGKILNHWVAVFHFPKKKLFALVDSTSEQSIIFDDIGYILNRYDVIEIWNIRDKTNKTIDFTLIDQDCYLKTIINNID